ncbi:uracil-DNA glycosylase family protein [Sphingomonas qomolangmaensis]|uniref:Uracil-DNA glycosylase n=1 Tax=Sphingomonas qomolangmaensis TaxID=2918765 RepID=A0ABY5LE71_9SPHN|nr:uracil-DNA glycosylase family protein [Sphingomonas qomolangmaensis]UUL84176.1 uracil-DNA glycosylase [Sphingomonas qomolangmaensis]
MGADQHNDWQAATASALEWWADAGVDVLVEDQVRDWFAAPVRTPPATAVAAAEPGAAEAEAEFPETLEAFLAWRLGEGAPEAKWNAPLVAGEGDPTADLMVMLDHPTGDRLLLDAEARLLDRMLAAIGRSRGDVYLTTLCLAAPLAQSIPADDQPALVARAQHLAALAGTKTVLLLSQSASRAFLGTDRANARACFHDINHRQAKFSAISSVHPRFLLSSPAHKREAWKDLQLLLRGKRT